MLYAAEQSFEEYFRERIKNQTYSNEESFGNQVTQIAESKYSEILGEDLKGKLYLSGKNRDIKPNDEIRTEVANYIWSLAVSSILHVCEELDEDPLKHGLIAKDDIFQLSSKIKLCLRNSKLITAWKHVVKSKNLVKYVDSHPEEFISLLKMILAITLIVDCKGHCI